VLIDKTVPTLQQLQLQFPLGDTNARIITEVLWKAAFEIVNQIPIDKRQFAIELKPSELVEIFKLPTIRAKFDNCKITLYRIMLNTLLMITKQ